MNLEQLEALKTIVEEGSFRSASEKLNKAQSAVSYSIRKLEEQMGVKIFDRSQYRPQLTEEGKILFAQAKRVLNEAKTLSDIGTTLSQGIEAILHLGVSAPFPIEKVIPCFRDFASDMPTTRLKISIEVLATLDRLLAGEVDLAISELPPARQSVVNYIELVTMQLIPVAGCNHPLARLQGEVDESELMNYPQIVLRSTQTAGREKSAGVLEGATTWSVSDFLTKKTLLMGDSGWGTMPTHLVDDEIKNGKLRRLNAPSHNKVFIPFYLLKRKDKHLGPAGQYLWGSIESHCCGNKKSTGKKR